MDFIAVELSCHSDVGSLVAVRVSKVRLPYADVRGLRERFCLFERKKKIPPLLRMDSSFDLGILSSVQSTAFRRAPY